MNEIVSAIGGYMWWPWTLILLLGTGILLSVRTRFLQVRKFPQSFSMTLGAMKQQKGARKKGSVSSFEAFAAAVAGTVGTGSVVGVSTAIASGGAGAVFWMWLAAFFGMITKYSENILGLYFRRPGENGVMRGGPMYYIENGLKWKWLAVIFSVCCIGATFSFNMAQTNSISHTLEVTWQIPSWVSGLVVTVLAALVILGGIQRISKVASYLVPFMALTFLGMTIIVVCMNIRALPEVFAMIFREAFRLEAVAGGVAGYTIKEAMRFGVARGVFSNEAGLGSAVMAHCSSDTKEPVKQAMWGLFEVFLTIIICTLMAFMILTSRIDTTVNQGSAIALAAFRNNLGVVGEIAFNVILPLFAFTTVISWSYYGETATQYIFGKKSVLPYKILSLGIVFLGAILQVEFVWNLSDIFNALMAIPNLIALVALSGLVVKISQNFYRRQKGELLTPMLSAYEDIQEKYLKEMEEERQAAA